MGVRNKTLSDISNRYFRTGKPKSNNRYLKRNRSKIYRIELKVVNLIRKWYGSDNIRITINQGMVGVRFGYWNQIDKEKLYSLVKRWCIVEEIEIESDECGWLYCYEIKVK